MKNIKKSLAVCAAVSAMLSCGISAHADLIWEPIDDSFYNENNKDIDYIESRKYNIIKDCTVYDAPNGNAVGKFSEGSKRTILYSYSDKNGTVWGGFISGEDSEKLWWMEMHNCEVIYDNFSFLEEHENEITLYNKEFADYKTDKPINLWQYPGGALTQTLEEYPSDWTNYIYKVYKDDKGTWGYIPYIWGSEGWVYMDDPSADISVVTEENVAAGDSAEDSPEPVNNYTLPAALAVSAAALSAILLKTTKKKQ